MSDARRNIEFYIFFRQIYLYDILHGITKSSSTTAMNLNIIIVTFINQFNLASLIIKKDYCDSELPRTRQSVLYIFHNYLFLFYFKFSSTLGVLQENMQLFICKKVEWATFPFGRPTYFHILCTL